MRLNLGIRRRLAPLLDFNEEKWFLLHALFLSLPGTPIVYYGDEIGMADNIWLPDRHGCRTPMQWDDSKNAGFSQANETYLPVNDDYHQRNVATQEDDPGSYLNRLRFLLQTRQSQPALQRGDFAFVETGNEAVLAFRRFVSEQSAVSDGQWVLCLFNLSANRQQMSLGEEGTRPYRDLLHANSPSWPDLNVTLPPRAAHWLVEDTAD